MRNELHISKEVPLQKIASDIPDIIRAGIENKLLTLWQKDRVFLIPETLQLDFAVNGEHYAVGWSAEIVNDFGGSDVFNLRRICKHWQALSSVPIDLLLTVAIEKACVTDQ